jgi:hypothetical protein
MNLEVSVAELLIGEQPLDLIANAIAHDRPLSFRHERLNQTRKNCGARGIPCFEQIDFRLNGHRPFGSKFHPLTPADLDNRRITEAGAVESGFGGGAA